MGSAGGRFPGQGIGGAGAQFQNSSVAKEGDVGSQLPKMPAQAIWEAGSSVEVGWTVMANHGGGYAYRLAPADGPLTEERSENCRWISSDRLLYAGMAIAASNCSSTP